MRRDTLVQVEEARQPFLSRLGEVSMATKLSAPQITASKAMTRMVSRECLRALSTRGS
jgi:hypothetical protein